MVVVLSCFHFGAQVHVRVIFACFFCILKCLFRTQIRQSMRVYDIENNRKKPSVFKFKQP